MGRTTCGLPFRDRAEYWSKPFDVDVAWARKAFDRLSRKATPSWRLRQFEARLGLFEGQHEMMDAQGLGQGSNRRG